MLLQDEHHGDVIAKSLELKKLEIKNSMLSKSFIESLLSKVNYKRMLIVGNFKEQDALTLSLDISSILGLTSNTLPEICSKVARIEPGQVIEWNSKHITSK